MDVAILHDRLAAAEKALLLIDERLDAAPDYATELIRYSERIASLEGDIAECKTLLQTLTTQREEAETRIAEALADEAEAQAQEAEAEAETAEALAEAISETPSETEELETADEEIAELEPEPESEGEGPASSRSSWWENLFALR